MILYLLRHAIAMDQSEWRKADSDRPLTKEGAKKMKKAARGIRHLNINIDTIVSSPYRRAHDTALIVAKELKLKKELKISRMLTPDGDPKALVRHLIRDYRSWQSILLVGHEPYMSRLASFLTSGNDGMSLSLEKGGLLRLSADTLTYGRSATLEWSLPPKILRKL